MDDKINVDEIEDALRKVKSDTEAIARRICAVIVRLDHDSPAFDSALKAANYIRRAIKQLKK